MGMGFAVTSFVALRSYLLTAVLHHFPTATPSCVFYYYLVLSLLMLLILVVHVIVEEHYERYFDEEEEYMREVVNRY